MSARRPTTLKSATPVDLELELDVVPSSSGGYRLRRGSTANMEAVRPEMRQRASSTTNEVSGVRPHPVHEHPVHEIEAPSDAPLSSGRMLDEHLSFDFDIDADGALELDCLPSSHRPREEAPRQSTYEPPAASRRISTTNEAPPPSQGRRALGVATMSTVDTHASLLAFAGFGAPPTKLRATPAYALRVIRRRRGLRQDLEAARRHRVNEAPLYEAALRTADDAAVRTGILTIGVLVVLSLLLALAVVQVLATFVSTGL